MSKQEWLEENVLVDEYGRPPGLADIPLHVMKRKDAFFKRQIPERDIEIKYKLWEAKQKKS